MPTIPVYLPIKEIKIIIEYSDKHVKGANWFENVQQFAEFLKDNPEIGKALGYVPKVNTKQTRR